MTPRGTAKILDFGLARTVTAVRDGSLANSGIVETHTVRGTLPYMAPEVLGGHPADARSDIYSLGVTMYEMCCGERPFQAPDLPGLAAEVIAHSPHRLSEQCPDVSPELDAVVECAMAVEPDTRYQSATELREVLLRLIVAEGDIETRTTALAPPQHPAPVSRAGRQRFVAGGLATALIAVVIGLVGTVGRQDSTSALAAVPVVAIVLQASATSGPGALAAGFADRTHRQVVLPSGARRRRPGRRRISGRRARPPVRSRGAGGRHT